MDERRIVLQPSRSEVNILFENIVNKSVLKLVRNNQRIINDKDISTIIYGSSSE